MRILIAEDDLVPRTVLERTLKKWGHEVVVTCDGAEAWYHLQREDAPRLAILDWMMPGLDGPEVCRKVRALARQLPTYLILLTAKQRKEEIVVGLESGADDYVVKPFDQQELLSRIRVGQRMVELQRGLADRVRELENALAQVRQLKGLLPICCYCKKVRDDQNYWQQVETYLATRSEVSFSHGICPHCWKDVVEPQIARVGQAASAEDLSTARSGSLAVVEPPSSFPAS
jgi:DNA-binding response OmpR family regulator